MHDIIDIMWACSFFSHTKTGRTEEYLIISCRLSGKNATGSKTCRCLDSSHVFPPLLVAFEATRFNKSAPFHPSDVSSYVATNSSIHAFKKELQNIEPSVRRHSYEKKVNKTIILEKWHSWCSTFETFYPEQDHTTEATCTELTDW